MGASIRRGLAAGLLAGLLAGFFALLVGEIPLREAIALEEQAASDPAHSAHTDPDDNAETGGHAHGHDDDEELVSRWTQQALLPVGSGLVGTAYGGLFGLAFALLRPRLRDAEPWRASLRLGAVAALAVALFPALTYPTSPPGAGDPDGVGSRTGWYLAAIVLAALLAAGLWRAGHWLADRGVAQIPRQLALAGAGVIGYGCLFWALPASGSANALPAELVWEFRLASIATQVIIWAGIAAGFGYLCRRAATGDRLGGEGPPVRRPELV